MGIATESCDNCQGLHSRMLNFPRRAELRVPFAIDLTKLSCRRCPVRGSHPHDRQEPVSSRCGATFSAVLSEIRNEQ